MKRVLVLVLTGLLLVVAGCSGAEEDTTVTAHINISDELVQDSYQVMQIIENATLEDREPELDTPFAYTDKYLTGYDEGEISLTDEEINLVMITSLMIRNSAKGEYVTIESEKRDFQKDKEDFFEVLETGKSMTKIKSGDDK